MWVVESVFTVLLGLGAVAFITLLERKLLGLSQIRLGPNKVSLFGVLQPVMDGVKLLFKENFFITSSQGMVYFFSPFILLVLFVITWMIVLPWTGSHLMMKYTVMFYFSLLGLGAYAVILTGWGSTSSFSKLGSLRGMLQSLSFEVVLILLFISALTNLKGFSMKMEEALPLELFFLWLIMWVVFSLLETNRAPFDLLEGESELISGFNVEMGSVSFVYLFLSEYGMIIVMALIGSIVITGEVSSISIIIFSSLLFMRSCFPRVRYDIMMTIMWQVVLPVSILMFLFFLNLF